MKNMGDHHDHCLKKDVLLLADVFEKFIDTCVKDYLTCEKIWDKFEMKKILWA